MQNVSHENHLIFMRMTVQVTYIFIPIVCTKTRFATEAKVNLGLGYSSMSWLREPLSKGKIRAQSAF